MTKSVQQGNDRKQNIVRLQGYSKQPVFSIMFISHELDCRVLLKVK